MGGDEAMRLKRVLVVAIGIVAALAIVACGGSPSAQQTTTSGTAAKPVSDAGLKKAQAAVAGLSGKERADKLAKMAEDEGGELSLYTSMTSDVEDAVSEAFADEYDIDVSVYRSQSETVLERLSQEAKAGYRGADVVETNGPELFTLNSQRVLAPYEPPARSTLVPGSSYDGWTADRFNKFVISWNTKLVRQGEQPRSWEDLADPKWKGRLEMELSDVDWYKTLYEYWVKEKGKSPQEADQLFAGMARNASFIKGHTVMGQLLGAGEYAVSASNYSYLVQNAIEKGSPQAWKPVVQPVLARPNGVAVVRGAKHPAAAMLFNDWILSEEGQKLLAKLNLDASRKDMVSAGNSGQVLVDLPSLLKSQAQWEERYDKLTRLGKVVEDES
jgi:iron(III) transport system substrate-binding protein